jgi:8-oxo-dGTP pyrophosphatase MutT (NUDIX family)
MYIRSNLKYNGSMITTTPIEDESGYEKRSRAGLIPYLRGDDGVLRYLMMVSSDPKFGGPRPMISKGKIEDGETPIQGAIREAEEELGFKQRNIRGEYLPLFDGRQELFSGAYHLTVFGVEIQDRYDFDKWCDETEFTTWMTLESFRVKGRKDHVKFVEALEEKVGQS